MTASSLFVLLRIACLLLVGYAGLCLFVYWRQEKMLFFPEQAPLETVRREARMAGFRLWPEDNGDYRALIAEPAGQAVGTCLIWHGNAGSARQRDYLAMPLLRMGMRVVVAEYPGYGARQGGGLREAALVADARILAADLHRRFGEPLIVIGESLGAAFAAAVAGDQSLPVKGVILVTPWRDLAGVARVHYPWLPAGLLLRDRFDNAAALQAYRGPLLVVTADSDEIIPASEGRRLYQALNTPVKRLYEIPGAGHNDWVERVTPEEWRNWLVFAGGTR
ncbi:MAG: alpha/beta hydrolase [Desulfuromonas sp.]|nr:alpha/beta hydrolase [Desulfuromonas sp.]